VQLYLSQDENARHSASAALKELGPKAVPDIIRMLRRKDPFIRRQVWSVAAKLPPQFRKGIVSNVKPQRAGLVHIAGMRAVAAIGPEAVPALPELNRILQGKDLQETWEAGYALGAMGPEAIRALTAALHSEYPAVMQAALAGLKQIGPAAGQAVPAMIESSDTMIRQCGCGLYRHCRELVSRQCHSYSKAWSMGLEKFVEAPHRR